MYKTRTDWIFVFLFEGDRVNEQVSVAEFRGAEEQ